MNIDKHMNNHKIAILVAKQEAKKRSKSKKERQPRKRRVNKNNISFDLLQNICF